MLETDADRLATIKALGEEVTFIPSMSGGPTVPIWGLFEDEFRLASFGGIEVESSGPAILVRDIDVRGVAHGDQIIRMDVPYSIWKKEPDGSGMTVLHLRNI